MQGVNLGGLIVSGIVLMACCVTADAESTEASAPHCSGPQDHTFVEIDNFVVQLMDRWEIPGAAVALASKGEVIHCQGFGYADRDQCLPATPDTLFRIASISKPITAVAVMKLVEMGKASLETTLEELLPDLLSEVPDANMSKVTVLQLLQHSAGWDDGDHDEVALRDDVRRLARQAAPGANVSAADVIARRLQRPLDFFPGSDHAYSNFGYILLGRIVEHVYGKPYLASIRELVFADLGASCPIFIGSPWLTEPLPNESVYYDYAGASPAEAALQPGREVAWPDGGIATTTLDAALGCVTTAPCLALFIDHTFAALDEHPGLLKTEIVQKIIERPRSPLWVASDVYYGLGWRINFSSGQPYIWHGGSMPGTSALLARGPGGISIALLMNSRPRDWQGFNDALQEGIEKHVN